MATFYQQAIITCDTDEEFNHQITIQQSRYGVSGVDGAETTNGLTITLASASKTIKFERTNNNYNGV